MRELLRNKILRLGLLVTISLLGVLFLFSCEESTGPGKTTPPASRKLLIFSDKNSIPANGGSAQILVKVYAEDDTTNVVSGVKVIFAANQAGTKLAIIVQNDLTDAGGYARATLYAGSRAGTATVTASLENFSNSKSITVTTGTGLVSADPSAILADGISLSTITATVIDSLGQPLPGAQVIFAASNDVSITPQSFSNETGRAVAILRSIPSVTDISCVITATTQTGKIAKVALHTENAAKPTGTADLIGTTTVILKGVTISGSVDRPTVLANNADSTLVTITLKETSSGDPVKDAAIKYSATLGTLRAAEDITDTDGKAEVVLFGGNVAGTSSFTATYADSLAYTSRISLIKQVFMTMESNPSVLSANGTDISAIKAYLFVYLKSWPRSGIS